MSRRVFFSDLQRDSECFDIVNIRPVLSCFHDCLIRLLFIIERVEKFKCNLLALANQRDLFTTFIHYIEPTFSRASIVS